MSIRLRHLGVVCLFAAFALAGCDAINDKINEAVPDVAIADGVFGLNGETGAEATGTFSDAGKNAGIEAVASLGLTRSFDDVDAGDFSQITSLSTTIGLAILTGNVGMTLNRGSAAALPNTIQATAWSLNWSISDANHQGTSALGTPSGNPILSSAPVTFTRLSGCAATAASCGYTASNAAALLALFPVEATQTAYLNSLSAVVMKASGGTNTPNSVNVTLRVTVSNPATELAGISASVRIAEYETSVTPVIF